MLPPSPSFSYRRARSRPPVLPLAIGLVVVLAAALLAMPATAAPVARSQAAVAAGGATSAGGEHGCEIRTPGTLWCWGRNTFGQLGIGTKSPGPVAPTQVGTKTDWTSVAAGGSTTCAIRGPGRLYCWGLNHRGQLGDGANVEQLKPRKVRGQGDVTQVSVGWFHTCALGTDKTLKCWGDNSWGQLGQGNTKQDKKIHQVKGHWKFVSTAGWNTCGIKSSGKLKCWGRDLFGQVGNGTTGDVSKPDRVGTATNWAEVDLSWTHACGRQSNGAVSCWGRNDQGQVADGAPLYTDAPFAIPGGHVAASVAVAEGTSCLTDTANGVWCWGDNRYGQVGRALDAPAGIPAKRTEAATGVVGGWFHFCATGSPSVCWGNNERGQLGHAPAAPSASRASAPTSSKKVGFSFRLATMNVLGNNHSRPFADADQFGPSRVRADWTAQSLINNGIDVAGLQEQDAGQLGSILEAADGKLASFPTPAMGDLRVEAAIVWRTDRFDLVKSRTVDSQFIRRTLKRPIVKLKDKVTGREFWVMNIHNAPWEYQKLRNKAVKVQIEKIKGLEAKGLPVFYVGDFNEKKTILCKVLKKTGLSSASGGRLTATGECVAPKQMRVDWIFGSSSVTWQGFEFSKTPLARLSTDHFVPVVDVVVP